MINLIMGIKGSGKTKALIDKVNKAVLDEMGDVVCINKGNRFMYDLNHKIRLIDTDQFKISNFDMFYGFICGIISEDFDITHIFIDSILKIVPENIESLDKFIVSLEQVAEKFNIKFTITISEDCSKATDNISKYMVAI